MRFLPDIRYGTEGYPEKVARRLRTLNFTTRIGAIAAGSAAVVHVLDPTPDLWKLASVDAVAAVIFAAVPLFHRFGPIAAALTFLIVGDAYFFALVCLTGTGSGVQMYYFLAAAFAILFFGREHFFLSVFAVLLAALLIVVLEILVPHNTGLMGPATLLATFIFTSVVACAALFLIVYYAVREAARAEDGLAREHAIAQDKSRQLELRTSDLSEALQMQTTTADVLKVISRSVFDLQAVLDTLVEAAARLCEADASGIARQRGAAYFHVAHYGVPPGKGDLVKNLPLLPGRESAVGRVLVERRSVQIADVLTDPEYAVAEFQRALGIRTLLGVPLLREGNPIGVFVLWRQTVRPFSDRQIELVTTFADQAAIAIQNVRLFDEIQAGARELRESLEQQTATADVLKIISRSTFDLQAVLDTLVEAAARLCEADASAIARQQGAAYYQVAHHGTPPGYDDLIRHLPLRPGRGSVVGRVLMERNSVQIPDVLVDPEYTMPKFQRAGGVRTLLGVPLLREGNTIGVFVLWRCTVRPFSNKQIELLTTFADQAVIAIENARLFEEIRDKTHQLEVANTYKSHFLASASHDLRQPLHALNLFVSQLRGETDPAERSRLVGRIDASVDSMNELFEALLDMTKLEAGILEANPAAFPISRLLERIETTLAEAARNKGLSLRVVGCGAWVRSDPILLERILLNLVSNAVRYAERGGVVVGCRRRGNQLRIDVCDTGAGIPEDQRQRIFAEYYQLPSSSLNSGGLGLGLAIVDRLGHLLGHPVELDSRPGRGSRFSVTVPLAQARRTTDVQATSSAAVIDPAHGKRVLVIDDDALVLDGMRGILQSWGCEVETADSGDAAIARLAANGGPPDLIISDSRLAHGETGIEAIARLRQAAGFSIPAFVITGDTAPERLREASAGGFHLLHKPVSPMALRTTLNRLLRTPASTLPAPVQDPAPPLS